MAWEKDWLKWTHATYGLLQSVRLAERIELGNLAKLQSNIEGATQWSESRLGFQSVASRRKMSPGSIHLKAEDSDRLLEILRTSVLQMILLTTISLTEGILSDLLASAGDGVDRPANLKQALDRLNKKMVNSGGHADNGRAVQAMHEARILRNCIAHGSGVWSDEAVKQFGEQFQKALQTPVSGEAFTISVDDIFAYRRAAKTVLNEAAHLLRPMKRARPRPSSKRIRRDRS